MSTSRLSKLTHLPQAEMTSLPLLRRLRPPHVFFSSISFSLLFCLFRAAPVAYGGSQARISVGAIAASHSHSYSNAGSEPCLQPTPRLTAAPDLSPTEWCQGMEPESSRILAGFITDEPQWKLPLTLFSHVLTLSQKNCSSKFQGSSAMLMIPSLLVSSAFSCHQLSLSP